jgi:hypothetical protein
MPPSDAHRGHVSGCSRRRISRSPGKSRLPATKPCVDTPDATTMSPGRRLAPPERGPWRRRSRPRHHDAGTGRPHARTLRCSLRLARRRLRPRAAPFSPSSFRRRSRPARAGPCTRR